MKTFWRIVGIVFGVILIVITGLYFYFIYVPPSAKHFVVTPMPAPVPGPDDAYWYYQKMLASYPGIPQGKEFERLMDFKNKPIVQDISVLHQLTEKYKEPLNEFEQGSQKTVYTIPIPPLPQGQLTNSFMTTYMTLSIDTQLTAYLVMAKIMVLRGKLAELENRPEDAIQDYATVINVGEQLNQTNAIKRLISNGIRGIGISVMGELLSQTNSISVASTIFEKMKSLEPPPIWDEKDLVRYEPGLRMKDTVDIPRAAKMILERIAKPNLDDIIIRNNVTNTKQEMVYIASAIRVYQSKNQKMPEKLENLVPDPLTTLPQDPFTSLTFNYFSQSTEVVLYSVGPDTTDDHAQLLYDPTNGTMSKGDIVVKLTVN